MKVLHITNWYPNEWNTYEGVFVREQFHVFTEVTEAKIINVQVRVGKPLFAFKHQNISDKEAAYFIITSLKKWKIIELFSTYLMIYVLIKEKVNKYDVLQVHIAYPLLRFYKWWKKLVKVPIVISEHWTAYHLHFNMGQNNKKLDGIRSVFWSKLPVITVSRALQNDIYTFAKTKDFPSFVLPNLLDLNTFKYVEAERENKGLINFFIVNVWRPIKNPFPMLEAFSLLIKENPQIRLTIGGYGDLIQSMMQFVKGNNLSDQVKFLGKISKSEIAGTLADTDAYLFSSNYETFSVACAQALCCGVPLIGPSIDAIREYASEKDGIFIDENNVKEWLNALQNFIKNRTRFNKVDIAKRALDRFSVENFKADYLSILNTVTKKY